MDDHDYWAAQFVDERIPLSELYKLMETVNADEKARNESLPESTRTQSSAKEVGLGVAELLLSRHLGVNWTAFYLDKQHLWLLDVRRSDTMKPNIDWVIHGAATVLFARLMARQKTASCREPVISIRMVWKDTTIRIFK